MRSRAYRLNTMRLSRRTLLAGAGALALPRAGRGQSSQAMLHCPVEWSFTSAKQYANPFSDVDVDVIVRDPDGAELRSRRFGLAIGPGVFDMRRPRSGTHTWRTISTDPANAGLHGQQGTIAAVPYTGANPLYRHGSLRVAERPSALSNMPTARRSSGWPTPGGWGW